MLKSILLIISGLILFIWDIIILNTNIVLIVGLLVVLIGFISYSNEEHDERTTSKEEFETRVKQIQLIPRRRKR